MKGSKKASGGKKGGNRENDKNNPDDIKEQDGKEKKKEKKKRHFLKIKWIPILSTKCKDMWENILPKKKSHSNEMPQMSPAPDNSNLEMEQIAGMGAPHHTVFGEHEEQMEEQKSLLEGTRERNGQDQQNLKGCDTFPATEQFEKLTTFENDSQGSFLAQTLRTLANAMQNQPVLAKLYERQLQFVIRLAAKDNLKINELHCLLSWIKTTYPNIVRKTDLRGHINDSQLLRSDEIRDLEEKYKQKIEEDLKKVWGNALKIEEQSWEQNPDDLSEISHNILMMFNGAIKTAMEISEDFVNRVMPIVENEFLQFLNRYKSSFNNYHKKNRTTSHFKKIIMTNMNYCSHFSDFVKDASANEEQKQKMNLILQEIEKEGNSILLEDLFKDVDCKFRTVIRAKGLTSEEIMRENISSANDLLSSLSTLSDKCRQVTAAKIHMHLVTKYLTKIKDIRKCNAAEQKVLATQMDKTAKLLSHFSTRHLNDDQQTDAAWANNVICKIAKIIQNEDLKTIKQDVGVLGHEYPDIRRRHVKSFLCIKNNLTNSERNSAVKMLDGIKREDPPLRLLFTLIPCQPCHCLIL